MTDAQEPRFGVTVSGHFALRVLRVAVVEANMP